MKAIRYVMYGVFIGVLEARVALRQVDCRGLSAELEIFRHEIFHMRRIRDDSAVLPARTGKKKVNVDS